MSECFVGEILLVPYLRGAPQGWLICDGSLQSISSYETLYTLLGTTYGGDGQSTFGLPDLRGRVPIHRGTRPGGSVNYNRGDKAGAENVTLITQQLPVHNHVAQAAAPGTTGTVATGVALASLGPASGTQGLAYATPGGTQTTLTGTGITASGGGGPHANIQPCQALTYIICTDGVYPTQN